MRRVFPLVISAVFIICIIPDMRRLIIARILTSNLHTIRAVVHERIELVLSRDHRSIYYKACIIHAASNDLFPPVTEQIGNQAWIVFTVVICKAIIERSNSAVHIAYLYICIVRACSVKKIVIQITIPENALIC